MNPRRHYARLCPLSFPEWDKQRKIGNKDIFILIYRLSINTIPLPHWVAWFKAERCATYSSVLDSLSYKCCTLCCLWSNLESDRIERDMLCEQCLNRVWKLWMNNRHLFISVIWNVPKISINRQDLKMAANTSRASGSKVVYGRIRPPYEK
jgi:hypothetical protein